MRVANCVLNANTLSAAAVYLELRKPLGIAMLFVLACFCQSQSLANSSAMSAPTTEAVGSWADQAFQEALTGRRISGGGLVWVKDGKVELMRGYGFEDQENKIPFDKDATVFRLQSVTKVFIATAIIKLIESGRVESLNASANKYLKRIQLEKVSDREITLLDLLTHRAGLESLAYRFSAKAQLGAMLSSEEIRRILPPVAIAPGEPSMYSNAGFGVLGLIIEDIVGSELDAALRQLIFTPVGMVNTFVGHPPQVPAHLARASYTYPNGELGTEDPELLSNPFLRGSGSIYTTLGDMGKFVALQLDAGQRAQPILSAASFQLLHKTSVQNHPLLEPQGLAFLLRVWNGLNLIEKGGAPNHSTRILLMPELKSGVFFIHLDGAPVERPEDSLVTLFSRTKFTPNQDIKFGPPFNPRFSFLSRFFGAEKIDSAAGKNEPASLVGSYWVVGRPTHRPWLAMYLPAEMHVTNMPAGLMIDGRPFEEIGADLYIPERSTSRGDAIGFIRDMSGQGVQIRTIDSAYERVPYLQSAQFLMLAFVAAFVLQLTCLIAARWPASTTAQRIVKWLTVLQPILAFALLAALILFYPPGKSIESETASGGVFRYAMAIACGNALFISSLLLCGISFASWKHNQTVLEIGKRFILRKIHLNMISFASALMAYVVWKLNFVGFTLPL